MALFTDGSIATLTDLKAYEGTVLDLAVAEGIDLTQKLAIAQREIGLELTSFLLRRGALSDHNRDLKRVLVTEPLIHAHVIRTLALTYRDVCNSQMNDRYERKWKQYSDLSAAAVKQLFDIGVGITRNPLARPEVPQVTATPGSVLPGATYYVAVAATGVTGATSEWSDTVQLNAVPGLLLLVSSQTPPAEGAGFVVYAGTSMDTMTRQTDSPVASGAVWTQSHDGLRTDLPALPVQRPDFYVANRQELLRG